MHTARKLSALLLCGGLSAAAFTTTGCVSYANWPPVPDDTALNDPNAPATEDVMLAGLRWAVNKFPPEGSSARLAPPPPARKRGEPAPAARAAINLPEGVKPAVYRQIAEGAGGTRGGIVPVTAETESLPIYHVGWVRIRGDEAYMTVFRPVVDIAGTATTQKTYQEIRLGLRGGLKPWEVFNVRPWDVGTRPAPAINYYEPEPVIVPRRPSPAPPTSPTFQPAPRAIEPAPGATPTGSTPAGGEQPK
jgi:hypothetical protein